MSFRLDLPRLATAIALIGIFAMAVRVPASPDMWWHLRCGEVQWRTGTVLTQETFSHTALGAPWINQSWLPQLALYALHAWGGFPALALAVGLLVGVTYGLVGLAALAGEDAGTWWAPYWRAGVILWAAIASGPTWAARPHLLTLFFTALWVYLLERWRARGSRAVDLLWLPPLMLLWANSHGGYVVGLLLLAIEAGGLGLKALVGRASERRDAPLTAQEAPPQSPPEAGGEEEHALATAQEAPPQSPPEAGGEEEHALATAQEAPPQSPPEAGGEKGRALATAQEAPPQSPPEAGGEKGRALATAQEAPPQSPPEAGGEKAKARVPWTSLLIITLLCLIAATINPQGIRLLLFPFHTLSSVQQSAIAEWASPDFHAPELWPFLGLLLASWAALALSPPPAFSRESPAGLLRALCFSAMALRSSRYIGLAAVVLAPLLIRHGAEVIARTSRIQGRAAPRFAPAGSRAARGRPALNWALLALVLLAAGVKIAQPLNPRTIDRVHQQRFPVESAAWLISSDLPPELFNEYGWGGYLIWATARARKPARVFVDGRADPYGDELLGAYQRAMSVRPGWEDTLDRYGVRTVWIGADSALAVVLRESSRWREVYADETAVILQKIDP